jgi:hypothetical protein
MEAVVSALMVAGMNAFRDRPISNCALGIGLVLVVGAHIAFWVEVNYLRNERDAKQMYDHIAGAAPIARRMPRSVARTCSELVGAPGRQGDGRTGSRHSGV